jgi:hypothetical protein
VADQDNHSGTVWPLDRTASTPVAVALFGDELHLGRDSRTLVALNGYMVVAWNLDILSRHPLPRQGFEGARTKACASAGRGLDDAEWARYLPDQAYEKTCP